MRDEDYDERRTVDLSWMDQDREDYALPWHPGRIYSRTKGSKWDTNENPQYERVRFVELEAWRDVALRHWPEAEVLAEYEKHRSAP